MFRKFQAFAVSYLVNKTILSRVRSCSQFCSYVLHCAFSRQNYGYYVVVKVAAVKYSFRNMQIRFTSLFVSV